MPEPRSDRRAGERLLALSDRLAAYSANFDARMRYNGIMLWIAAAACSACLFFFATENRDLVPYHSLIELVGRTIAWWCAFLAFVISFTSLPIVLLGVLTATHPADSDTYRWLEEIRRQREAARQD